MDTKPTKMTILLAFLCFFGLNVAAQEVAPEKTFEFTIGLNKLKTQEQHILQYLIMSQHIQQDVLQSIQMTHL